MSQRPHFIGVASVVPALELGNCDFNATAITDTFEQLTQHNAKIAVYPEMCLTGYTCGDLFHSRLLIDDATKALVSIARATANLDAMIAVGLPMANGDALYNCAAVLHKGTIKGIVPKTYIPNYGEFYEKRWFAPGTGAPATINIDGVEIPFGTDLLFDIDGVKTAIEICEDLWSPVPPSTLAAMQGAHITLNLSASDDVSGKYDYLVELIKQQSARTLGAYVYSSSGHGESSTDLVFDGKCIIAELGAVIKEAPRWTRDEKILYTEIDLDAIYHARRRNSSFTDCARQYATAPYRTINLNVDNADATQTLTREIDRTPYIPKKENLTAVATEILEIQRAALARRLEAAHSKHAVIGISGGLDSTLALIVTAGAFDLLGIDRKGIVAVTMPGFGTTDRTLGNARRLMEQLGVTHREIPIAAAVTQHFADIGHDPSVRDITYENSQARERTQLLMDIANQVNGLVIGTGDMSELALGWATYNGDHMSMYGVNAGIPKTLVKELVKVYAHSLDDQSASTTLLDIVDTPISPELLPADAADNILQVTEDLVGPYELHDFFMYHLLHHGREPRAILALALKAFNGAYSQDTILKWLKTFLRRFFAQQFKRSCLPDGPKVMPTGLSPRGDWRMPSDAVARAWLAQLD